MKNIIALLICIMSLTIIAEADHIRFKTYPSKLKKGLNSFTFDYSATYHSRIYIQVFDENWKQVYSYDFIAENYNSHAWANIPLKANNSSVHYVQVKLISLSRKQIGWDQRKYYGGLQKNGSLSDAAEAGIQLEAYPNPVKDIFNLEYNLAKEGEVDVKIYDPMGKLVKVIQNDEIQQAGKYTNTIDASALNAGMYLIKVATEEGIETSRILKQ